jgi:nicotinate-nucleotide pyrophosphorylase (carboxylating)
MGARGDITCELLVPETARARGVLRAEEDLVAAGAEVAARVFALLDERVAMRSAAPDGRALHPGDDLLRVAGPARAILTGERTALNLLGRMCGIATLTRRAVDQVQGTRTRILDTRKTTPGLRALEKYAVRCGGGENHRSGLFDMVLIKENHIALAGSVGAAVRAARSGLPPGVGLQVEVEDLDGLDEAIDAGAELILLDNMDADAMAVAVERAGDRAELEASGGIAPEQVGDLARRTGVHRISLGSLTRRAVSSDVSMDLEVEGDDAA